MENNIFLRPAVAGVMSKHFVEARHHTDIQNTLTAAQFAANRKLRDEIAGTTAYPFSSSSIRRRERRSRSIR